MQGSKDLIHCFCNAGWRIHLFLRLLLDDVSDLQFFSGFFRLFVVDWRWFHSGPLSCGGFIDCLLVFYVCSVSIGPDR
ncbi:unnamed protein product [Calypogeia fissa]